MKPRRKPRRNLSRNPMAITLFALLGIVLIVALLTRCGQEQTPQLPPEPEPAASSEPAPAPVPPPAPPPPTEPPVPPPGPEPEPPPPDPEPDPEPPPPPAPATNPFTISEAGQPTLFVYNAPLLAYTYLGRPHIGHGQNEAPVMDAPIAAINSLPVLERINRAIDGSAGYGLLTVSADFRTRVQYFLYEEMLVVNGIAYAISSEQFEMLREAMELPPPVDGAARWTPPHWLIWMNPHQVAGVRLTGADGEMREIRSNNVFAASTQPGLITVRDVQIYEQGSKNFDGFPFWAVYTFRNGVVQTIYVSDITPQTDGVRIYIESSDMGVGLEYVVSGYISTFTQTLWDML